MSRNSIITGVALSQVIEPDVRVEKIMLTENTLANPAITLRSESTPLAINGPSYL
jgi:hypothetical protein